MKTSATKSEEKRRDWSVQRGVDHNKVRINPAVETRNRAQFLRQVPKQRRKSYRRLDRGANSKKTSATCKKGHSTWGMSVKGVEFKDGMKQFQKAA
jgi:hypothetical protein